MQNRINGKYMKSYLTDTHSQTVASVEFTTAIKHNAVINNISLKYSAFGSTCACGVCVGVWSMQIHKSLEGDKKLVVRMWNKASYPTSLQFKYNRQYDNGCYYWRKANKGNIQKSLLEWVYRFHYTLEASILTFYHCTKSGTLNLLNMGAEQGFLQNTYYKKN